MIWKEEKVCERFCFFFLLVFFVTFFFKESPRRFLNLATFYSKFLGDSKRAKSQFERYKVMHSSSLKMSTGKLVFKSNIVTVPVSSLDECSYSLDEDAIPYYCEGDNDGIL